MLFTILTWLLLGALAGWIASMVGGRNARMGAGANIVVGMIGAVMGGFIMTAFGAQGVTGFNLYSMLAAVGGAVVLLWIVGLLRAVDPPKSYSPARSQTKFYGLAHPGDEGGKLERYYRNPDPDRNPGMTRGHLVLAIRDHDAERLSESQRWPQAVSDIELCSYVEGLYLSGKHDNFKKHPEYKNGIEIRCENRNEAEHFNHLMWERYKTVIQYTVTYPS